MVLQLIFILAGLGILFIVINHLNSVWGKEQRGKTAWELLIEPSEEEREKA
ncbi:hypothetical protein LRR81_16880 [Metabacillus sp. GX 13764]|uniref:hypothetical protein n=1 Tax=Metabacillus kandeliae TaxID=2900151 RepID=UPI001E4836E0|nr:hypothetical protein [Metabacillus kandeliae]MCD7035921.1 hypothetical protein [Metabacillus kandeliae]